MTDKEFKALYAKYQDKYGKESGFGKGKWYLHTRGIGGYAITYYNADHRECINFLSRNMTREQVITCFEAMNNQEKGIKDDS